MTLLELQRAMASAIMAPLEAADRISKTGAASALALIKPNRRLTSPERLQIYARSYWYRVLDGLRDDFPGLRAILGVRAFDALSRAYLAELPSESFTLRNLGSRLPAWLENHPRYLGRNPALAMDMARLEWAHIVAFDAGNQPVLGPEHLLELTPRMVFHLQPYISLLELQYPVDDLHIKVTELAEGHGEVSNTLLRHRRRHAVLKSSLKREPIHLAVHRLKEWVYLRRLELQEFELLRALRAGMPVGEAIEAVFADSESDVADLQAKLEHWFHWWAKDGWFCLPEESQ
jgi:hypothetical protein